MLVSKVAEHLSCAAIFSPDNIQYPVLHLVVFQMLNVFTLEVHVLRRRCRFATSAVHAKATLRRFGLLELTLDLVVSEYR